MSMNLTAASHEIELVMLCDEIKEGEPISKANLVTFLQKNAKLAASTQEKLAGCQARMRSR